MSEGIGDFLDAQFAAQDGAAGAPPAESAPAGAPPVEGTPPAAEAPLDLDGELEGDKFDRAYVERLRREAASARTKAKELESVFEGYGDDEREGLAQLARMLKEDPKAAAAEMKAAYDAIMAQYQEPEASAEDFSDADRILTVGEYQKLQEQNAIQAEQRAIEAEAKELGYKVDAKDTDYRLLLLTAQNQTKTGSLQEAHQILKAREQAVIDQYLAAKAADAEDSYKAPADNAGQIPSNSEPIRSFKDARSALENYIAQQRTGM
jgi:hypothetical protein